MNLFNPYIAGNPVGGTPNFIGRADILREVLRVLRHPAQNAIVLFGQRRIGKTSVLQQLTEQLPKEGPFYSVYFDLQDKAAWPLARVLMEIARTIADALHLPAPDLEDDPALGFRKDLLPAVLNNLASSTEIPTSLVLLFDEFDVLADPKGEQAGAELFPYLRQLMTLDTLRLQFVFVIGRKIEDLSSIVLSVFKGVSAQRVSMLDHNDTIQLVRYSEQNETLQWVPEALEKVWELTHGHPFLTQQLCSRIWENLYDEEPSSPPTVMPEDVEQATTKTLEGSRNTMEWVWDGLPPAERVIIAALAGAGNYPITQSQLEQLLRESGVRVMIRELQNAPQLLQDWDLIEPVENGYRFRVELLRRWIVRHKPLSRVQDELDRIEPLAETLFQAANGFFRNNQMEEAVPLLRQAIGLNPNHVHVSLLLAEILISQSKHQDAIIVLEKLYLFQPSIAQPRLIQALLDKAQITFNQNEKLSIYEKILKIDNEHQEAFKGWQQIWEQRGDDALTKNDLPSALSAFKSGVIKEKIAIVEDRIRRTKLSDQLENVKQLEQEKKYQVALDLVNELNSEFGDLRNFQSDYARLYRQLDIDDPYQKGIEALQQGGQKAAQILFAKVIELDPEYKEVAKYFYQAVTGTSIKDIESQFRAEKKKRNEFEDIIRHQNTERNNHIKEIEALNERKDNLSIQIEYEINKSNKYKSHYDDELLKRVNSDKLLRNSQIQLASFKEVLPRLLVGNVIDQLQFLYWICIQPNRLKEYRKIYGKEDEKNLGKWLVSTLMWLPFCILSLSISFRILNNTNKTDVIYISLFLGIIVSWLITGHLGIKGIRVNSKKFIALADTGGVSGTLAMFISAIVIYYWLRFSVTYIDNNLFLFFISSLLIIILLIGTGSISSGLSLNLSTSTSVGLLSGLIIGISNIQYAFAILFVVFLWGIILILIAIISGIGVSRFGKISTNSLSKETQLGLTIAIIVGFTGSIIGINMLVQDYLNHIISLLLVDRNTFLMTGVINGIAFGALDIFFLNFISFPISRSLAVGKPLFLMKMLLLVGLISWFLLILVVFK